MYLHFEDTNGYSETVNQIEEGQTIQWPKMANGPQVIQETKLTNKQKTTCLSCLVYLRFEDIKVVLRNRKSDQRRTDHTMAKGPQVIQVTA